MAARETTISDYRERLNRVLLYIQEKSDERLSLARLAAVAHFSPFHFHRIFTACVGETLNEHIRRIRLDKAALKLYYSRDPVTSIALSAGYETPAAFAKAFKQRFGKSPTEYKTIRREKLPTSLQIPNVRASERRGMAMKPEIRILPEQKVLFVRKTGRYDKAAGEAWSTLMHYAYSHRLMTKDTRGIGISHDSPDITPEEQIRYDACITVKGDVKPEGEVGAQTIGKGKYAVFLHKGPYKNLGRMYNAIFSQWLPEAKMKLRDAPCFEVYLNRDPRRTKPEKLKTEIHVPVE